MREINLTQGKKAFVDDDDFDFLNQWSWFAVRNRNTYYAARSIGGTNGIKRDTVLMHRVIMKTPKGKQVDHINHNGLDNQRHNLRNCTQEQNLQNSEKGRSKYSANIPYKGVYLNRGKYIVALIRHNNKTIYLGQFNTLIEAAIAYDEAAKKYYGEFANLNFK